MTNYTKIAELHFDDLKATLENKGDKKAYVLIIEYMLNFLGCLSLAAINGKNLKELSRNENISRLTAGQWVNCIMRTLDLMDNQREKEQIRAILLTGDRQISPLIERWLDLRNKLTHDIILIDDKQLEQLLAERLLDLPKYFESFTEGLKRLIKGFPHLLQTKFFHIPDNTLLYIYAGIEDDYRIKYKHFKHQPLIVNINDFPLTYKKIFVSLEQTPHNILVSEDKITARIRTMPPRSGLKFQLWINGRMSQELKENVINGSLIHFSTEHLDIEDSENNAVEVKALQNNKEIASTIKNFIIYNNIPNPTC